MKHGSLFSGIGGFDLAAEWMGWENVFQVEWDEYCQKVLRKNFPNTNIYGDIKEFDGTKYRGEIDILSGGFPCQPFSHAGKRGGESDDRYLWPEYLRVIREIKPTYVVGENVAGILSMGSSGSFEEQVSSGVEGKVDLFSENTIIEYREEQRGILNGIIEDLEREGYTVETFLIPACSVGAWHRRDRIWIVAYVSNSGVEDMRERQNKAVNSPGYGTSTICGERSGSPQIQGCEDISNPNIQRLQKRKGEDSSGKGKNSGAESFRGSRKQITPNPTNPQAERQRVNGGEILSEPESGRSHSIIGEWGPTQSRMGRMVTRLPRWMDGYWDREPEGVPRVASGVKNRVDRLKGLGNAIVPQVALEIFKAINAINNQKEAIESIKQPSKFYK